MCYIFAIYIGYYLDNRKFLVTCSNLLYLTFFRRVWNISFIGELIYTPCHVHILLSCGTGTTIPKIPLVETIHDQITNSEYLIQHNH